MREGKRHLYDVDDLWAAGQITKHLVPLRRANPEFKVTAFAIPAKLGEVHLLKKTFPWITFAIHGWDHPPFECVAWTKEQTERYLRQSLDMGYDKLFKPPNWRYDEEVLAGLGDVVLAVNQGQQIPSGAKCWKPRGDYVWSHTHIQRGPSTDFIDNHPHFDPRFVEKVEEFVTPFEVLNG